MNTALIDYFKTIVDLEKQVYEQTELKNSIADKRNNYIYSDTQKYIDENYNEDFLVQFKYEFKKSGFFPKGLIVFIICLILGIVFFPMRDVLKKASFRFFFVAFGIVVVFFIASLMKAYLECERAKRENKRIVMENSNIKTKNEIIQAETKQYFTAYTAEYLYVKKILEQTEETLEKYYSLDIIYPKYRNLACVASILEYLLSGRCEELTGRDGAYNMLENDIKYNVINTKLDTIIDYLDDIRTNQTYLYEAINDANVNIQKVSSELGNVLKKAISENSTNMAAQISSQLKSIEYYNQVNSLNTKYLADMVLSDHLFS